MLRTRRNRAILLYILVAYGVTWLVWWPYVQSARAGEPLPNPFLYYFAAAGPFLAAITAEWYERGRQGVYELFRRLTNLFDAGRWIAVGFFSPLLLVPLAAIAVYLAGQGWPLWGEIGVSSRAPGLDPLACWFLMTLSYGIGEEVGWRGFLLPRLQARHPALLATVLLTLVWGGWHLPAFWFREGYVGMSAVSLTGFAIGLLAGAIVLTSLYNASCGSILVVALWHGGWNWVATSDGLQGPWVAVMTTVIIIAAPLLVWKWGARNLAPNPRTVL